MADFGEKPEFPGFGGYLINVLFGHPFQDVAKIVNFSLSDSPNFSPQGRISGGQKSDTFSDNFPAPELIGQGPFLTNFPTSRGPEFGARFGEVRDPISGLGGFFRKNPIVL